MLVDPLQALVTGNLLHLILELSSSCHIAQFLVGQRVQTALLELLLRASHMESVRMGRMILTALGLDLGLLLVTERNTRRCLRRHSRRPLEVLLGLLLDLVGFL